MFITRLVREWICVNIKVATVHMQVRAMDCYLIEGVRALYRIAMAILILFTQEYASEWLFHMQFRMCFQEPVFSIRPDKFRGAVFSIGRTLVVCLTIIELRVQETLTDSERNRMSTSVYASNFFACEIGFQVE